MKKSFFLASLVMLLACLAVLSIGTAASAAPQQESVELGAKSEDSQDANDSSYWRFQFFLKLNTASFTRTAEIFIPPSEASQEILSFKRYSPDFDYREVHRAANIKGIWKSRPGMTEADWIIYDLTVRLTDQKKPDKLAASSVLPDDAEPELMDPETEKLLDDKIMELGLKDHKLSKQIRIVFDYLRNSFETSEQGHGGNVARVLAANNGDLVDKNALFRAFLARLNVPTRTVNGVLLKDRKIKDSFHQWVQAHLSDVWVNFDIAHGFFGTLPADHFIIYYGDEPALKIANGVESQYRFVITKSSEEGAIDADDMVIPQKDLFDEEYFKKSGRKENFLESPVGRIAIITDDPIPDSVTDKIEKQAAENHMKVYFYSTPYESQFFRGSYIASILAHNFEILRQTDAIFIQSQDDASLYALFRMARNNKKMSRTSIFLNGAYSPPVSNILGYALYKLLKPKDLFITQAAMTPERIWDVLQDNILNGLPIKEVTARWNIPFEDLSAKKMDSLSSWRQFLIRTWILAAKAEVNLESIYLILILPFIALVIVIFRNIIGFETFGMFTPVLVSVAFLTTGPFWGCLQFLIIVATGLSFRFLFRKIHLHLVARLAMQIAMVGLTMLGVTIIGVHLGWGALINISILPMVIMAGMVESFTRVQMEHGTREALRLIAATLAVSIISYYIIDMASIQSLVLVFPEVTLAAIATEIAIGRWNGIRLLEYLRFYKIIGPETTAPEPMVHDVH